MQGQFDAASSAPVTANAPADEWWRLYGDTALDSLVTDALRENRDLAVAAAHMRRARAVLGEQQTQRLPETSASFGPRYGKAEADQTVSASRNTNSPAARSAWAPSFSLSWEVDLWGRVEHAIDAAGADAEAAAAESDAMRVSVAAQTVSAYLQACGLADQASVTHRTLEIAVRIANLTRRQRADGRVSDLEVTRAQAFVDDTAANLPVIEGNRRAALFELSVLTGRAPTDLPSSAAQCQRVPTLATPFPVGDGASLLQRRPDLRAYERRLAAATARVGVASADLYPRITLGASVDWLSSTGSLASLGDSHAVTWSVGPLIQWQFPNLSASRARLRAVHADEDAALAAFEGRVLVALKETEQALAHYGADWSQARSLAASREGNARALELAARLYKAGAIDFLGLLDAQRSLAHADAALARSTTQVGLDQVTVFKALGGGWQSLHTTSSGDVAAKAGEIASSIAAASAPATSPRTPLSPQAPGSVR
ncbi:RND transporter [Pandoraea capi]|uniref:RND transporter n=2 Tax=Pandoraea capi TaxID=2508286 RepID=A0ABY6VLD9_9BURK|nr:RND transporter [Pandoraea capi]